MCFIMISVLSGRIGQWIWEVCLYCWLQLCVSQHITWVTETSIAPIHRIDFTMHRIVLTLTTTIILNRRIQDPSERSIDQSEDVDQHLFAAGIYLVEKCTSGLIYPLYNLFVSFEILEIFLVSEHCKDDHPSVKRRNIQIITLVTNFE